MKTLTAGAATVIINWARTVTITPRLVLDGSCSSAHAAVDGVVLSAADGFVVARSLSDGVSISCLRRAGWQSSDNSDESEEN